MRALYSMFFVLRILETFFMMDMYLIVFYLHNFIFPLFLCTNVCFYYFHFKLSKTALSDGNKPLATIWHGNK